MDKKLKWGLIAGGAALIVLVPLIRGSAKGGSDNTALIAANTAWNQAATDLRMVQTQTAGDIVMNRDRITGQTNIQAYRTVENILSNNGAVTVALTQSYNGIINNRIASDTAKYIEDSRASVAKKVARYQYKAAKHGANMQFAGDALGFVSDIAGAFF